MMVFPHLLLLCEQSKPMMVFPHLLLLCSLLFSLLTNSAAVVTIATDQSIRDGETIVSAGEMYELGFFSPGDSKYRYLGIWYKKISPRTVVWVANREMPLTNTSGVFKLSSEGNLLLLSGGDAVIWSSNSSVSVRNSSPVAQLLDTGNLVVSDGSMVGQEKFVWQSFDYPSDTLLPGMKFGKDLVTGIERHLTSWKTPDDPSPGQFVHWMDTNGFPQAFERQGSVLRLRIGPWNGLQCSGWSNLKPNPINSVEFVLNQKEIYYKYELKSSVLQRVLLNWDGSLVMMNWIEQTQSWFGHANAPVDGCGRYGVCGAYGVCNINNNPTCSCMEGFEPKRRDEWNTLDWSSGCQHRSSLDCGKGDGFWKIMGVILPDTRHSWYNQSMTLDECEIACRSNCSCTAYANIDIRRGGSGCLLWFGELMDVRVYEGFQDLYLRMSASVLTDLISTQSRSTKKKRVLTMVLSVSSVGLVLLGLSAAVYECSKKKKSSDMKGRGGWLHVQKEDLELPFICFSKLVKATNNFSTENKLGEGGFGPVYKGVLEEGQEVAVKRLSKTSEQGLDEFQNEVICVAKLQHRNLVKLLGYCIHGDEKILIYEYMPNKSLDSFLFDETRSSMLDWPQRFSIIHGIARGLLYLHQDSRLRIIHRDLKAGNVLLDYDMNPKISDFGLARSFGGNETAAKTKKVVGTYGYISPEYAVHGRFSTKSDVFSFGVLVLEIVSGKKNRGFSHDDHRDNLLGHAWRLYKEDKGLELMSASLRDSCVVSEVERSIHVALLCVQHHAQDRPTMSSIVLMLGGDGVLASPRQPAFFTEESLDEPGPFSSLVDEATITLLDAR